MKLSQWGIPASLILLLFAISCGGSSGSGALDNNTNGNGDNCSSNSGAGVLENGDGSGETNNCPPVEGSKGIPDWLVGKWLLLSWSGSDLRRFNIIMTVTKEGQVTTYPDGDGECTSDDDLVMNPDTPMYESNEYDMTVVTSDCVSDWGPASMENGIDMGSITSDDGRFAIRFSSIFADYWEYRRIN